ncbi:MAG: NifU family protein [Alphaproteobacteria bacterium]
MFIQTELTPNPATIKFIPGQIVLESGTLDFDSPAAAEGAPLALRLFKLQGVERVFLGRDFISVTKNDDTDWSMLKTMVLAALMDHLSTNQPIVLPEILAKANTAHAEADGNDGGLDSEIVSQIKELLDTRVRPAVAMDGGDIAFESFTNGIVLLRMKGACAGCPSSTATLKSGIENMLKHYIPEVLEVRQVEY